MSSTIRRRTKRKRRSQFGRVCTPKGRRPYIQFIPPDAVRDSKTGRRRPVTKTVRSRREGEQLLKEIRLAILRGTYATPEPETAPCELTLIECVDEYLASKRAEGRSENGIRRYGVSRRAISLSPLAHRLVRDLQARDIESYMAWRRQRKWRGVRKPGTTRKGANAIVQVKGEGPSNASVNRDLALISASLNRLVRLDLLERNVSLRVKRGREPTKTRVVLSKEECARLLDACDPHLRILCLAAVLTGARPCELRALTWADVNFGTRTVNIVRTKVGNADAVPLHPTLAAELKTLRRRRARAGKRIVPDDEPIFLSTRGQPGWDYRWAWRKAVKRAGLGRRTGLSLYSLRHSFATHYLEHGAPSDLQAILGHASYATTERYVRAVSTRARASVEKLVFGT